MLRKILIASAFIVSGTAHAEWQEASSQHFVVYSDDSPANVKAFTAKLEKYDKALRLLRNVSDRQRGPASRVTIYMYGTIEDIQKLYNGKRQVGGFYQARATGSVAFVPRKTGGSSGDLSAMRILLHEYSHHFMYNDWPSAIFPIWFSEGFAEFNSTALFREDGSVVFGAPPLDRQYGVTMVNQMPLSRMLRFDMGKMSDIDDYVLYSRGWLLTHYLTFDPERRKQLADYIVAINNGTPFEEAAKVFGDLDKLDFRLTSYVKRPRFQSALLPASALTIGEIQLRSLTPGEAATMYARIRSNRGVDPKSAGTVAALARTAAAPFPNDAGAQNELAEAEYDAKNYSASEAASDRALAINPKSVHALLYRGMAQQAVAERDKVTNQGRWKAIRSNYVAANKIDTEDPQPLILFYQSFEPAGQKPPTSAQNGMLYAEKLAPFAYELRYEAAKIYLRQNKVAEAKTELRAFAVLPHGGSGSANAREAIAALDAGSAEKALQLIEAYEKEQEQKAKKGTGDDNAS